jgi:hypothetical protein
MKNIDAAYLEEDAAQEVHPMTKQLVHLILTLVLFFGVITLYAWHAAISWKLIRYNRPVLEENTGLQEV